MSGVRRCVPGWGIAVAVALAATVGAVMVLRGAGGEATTVGPVGGVRPATAPFAGLTVGRLRVGRKDLSVVVADSLAEREQGLRGRAAAAPYDGMLFVFGSDADADVSFTMAGVPAPLEIGFYDPSGRRVDRLSMEPCAGTDATCPRYTVARPFRYALEVAPGALPPGRLTRAPSS